MEKKEIVELKFPICKRHKPKSNELSYLAWHDWAEKMERNGKEQTQCKKCGHWYFKSEM